MIKIKWFLILFIFLVFFCGIFSDIHLGDEVLHFRLARCIFEQNSWPVYDPMNQSYANQKLYYIDPMLWHTLLAGLWKLTGGVCKIVAQFYQTMYLLTLILSTYIFTKELYGEKTAFWSGLILATIPIIPALTIILHTDIAVISLIMLGLVFLLKKKYLISGLIIGMAFLTKRTAYLFIPAIIIFFIYTTGSYNFKKKAGLAILFLLPMSILAALENFHHSHIITILNMSMKEQNPLIYPQPHVGFFLKDTFELKQNWVTIPFVLGISFIGSFLLYFLNRNYTKKDLLIWFSLVAFIVTYLKFFTTDISLRYSVIILPLLSIISAIAISNLKAKIWRNIFIILCLLQFISASIFTCLHRRIPLRIKQTYDYIKLNTELRSRIMCSRPDPQLYADRKTIWNNYLALKELPYLFWVADNNACLNIMNKYGIDYLLLEKDRIYDDTKTKHQLGWPKSFVDKIDSYSCVDKVLENKYISLWQVKR